MAASFGPILLATLVGLTVAFGFAILWIGNRITMPLSNRPSAIDPILGARDQVAVHDTPGPFIPMPDHLKTRNEMVAWMTQELPRLTSGMSSPRT